MALQHLAGDLCIPGLVSPEQPNGLHTGKKEKRADDDQGEDVDGTAQAVARRRSDVLAQDGDVYCTFES